MEKYFIILGEGFINYSKYLYNQIITPSLHNYFYWLILISIFIWCLEIFFPWRKQQSVFRKDFWLDLFYIFFNFFLFSLLGFSAISKVVNTIFYDILHIFHIKNIVIINLKNLPVFIQYILMFIIADFIQWNIHRLLHKSPILWQFHKVHHSIIEMGFAGHFRYHWVENIIYKTLQYIPLSLLGFGIQDFFILHIIAITIGHLNHSNINIDYAYLKYILNNPKMHLWHHAKDIPNYGVNFGISLSIWDYLFKTSYIPNNNENIALGFEKIEDFPKTFRKQIMYPWIR